MCRSAPGSNSPSPLRLRCLMRVRRCLYGVTTRSKAGVDISLKELAEVQGSSPRFPLAPERHLQVTSCSGRRAEQGGGGDPWLPLRLLPKVSFRGNAFTVFVAAHECLCVHAQK